MRDRSEFKKAEATRICSTECQRLGRSTEGAPETTTGIPRRQISG